MWYGWPLPRILFLLTGIVFMAIAVQVTLFHYRQNFRHWAQWIPVLAAPLFSILALLLAFYDAPFLRFLLGISLSVGTAAGLFGFYLHFTGVGERVDGYRVQNFLVGPPITLPLMISAISILGLLALYWR